MLGLALHIVIKILIATIVIIIIAFVIWYFFIKSDSTDNFVEFDNCDRAVRPWWWYTHMSDNLYYTPDYTFETVFYDGRPHNKWHYKYKPHNGHYIGNYHNQPGSHRSLNGSRHGSRHGPNHGRLRR